MEETELHVVNAEDDVFVPRRALWLIEYSICMGANNFFLYRDMLPSLNKKIFHMRYIDSFFEYFFYIDIFTFATGT